LLNQFQFQLQLKSNLFVFATQDKIFKAYCQQKGISNFEAVKFLLDGERIKPEDTPKMLEMNDGDQLDAVLQTIGGMGEL